MSEPTKIWKKCTAIKTLTDYFTDPPTVKEWIDSISTIDNDRDVMEDKEFDEEGRLIIKRLVYQDETHTITYDKNGNETSNEISRRIKNDYDDEIEISADDDGNLLEVKLEYDFKGRVISKVFVKNGMVESWIEFEYDGSDRVVLTKEFDNNKLEFYEEDVYVSDRESISLRYNSIGQLTLRTDYKELQGKNTFVNSYYNDEGNLTGRSEEDRNSEDEVLEQRFYDGNENLIQQIVFGENDEFGYRTLLVENFYNFYNLFKNITTIYTYEY